MVNPLAYVSETVNDLDFEFRIGAGRLGIEKMPGLSRSDIFPTEFFFPTEFHIVANGCVPARKLGHLALKHPVLIPKDLPFRVIIPYIGNYTIRLVTILPKGIFSVLYFLVLSHSLIIPRQFPATRTVDIIAPRYPIHTPERLPEESAQRGMYVFKKI